MINRSILFRLYLRGKVKLNYILDRIIDLSDMILMDAYQLPWPIAQNMAKKMARYIGNISWLLRGFPRLSAYKLVGGNWTIIFLGIDHSLLEISHLFFAEENIVPQEIGRVALWHLSAQTQQWLAEGTDLVVCELSCIHPHPPQATFTFTVPGWIHQTLTLPNPLENLLLGKHVRSVRCSLNRAKKANFSWYFSKSREDFDHFHYNMYLPYIKNRHGPRALLATYKDQWENWFVRGGLIIVTQNNTRVGGLLCYVKSNTCFAIEMGILDGEADLIKQGIKAFSDWSAINWAYQQGARVYDMGTTRPWRSNGVFIYKSRWQAKVVRREKIYGEWNFLTQNLSPSLQDHINKLGLISEIDEKFCGVLLSTEAVPVTESDIDKELLTVEKQGLDGIAVISNNDHQVILCSHLDR